MVTAGLGGRDPWARAVADLAADHRVAAEGLRLAGDAVGLQCPGGADAVARHRLTQPRAAAARWGHRVKGQRSGVMVDTGHSSPAIVVIILPGFIVQLLSECGKE